MKVFCLRIGEKYGIEYEEYINSKLAEHYDVVWIRNEADSRFPLQWTKMSIMSQDITEPVVVIDIDILLINDYLDLFNYPIKDNQFISINSWWSDNPNYSINGGFYKYIPSNCKYIYDKYLADYKHWQSFYIKNKTTTGPINGEQFFVEDSVKERLELITVPASWSARWVSNTFSNLFPEATVEDYLNLKYIEHSKNPYLFLGDEFHPDVKIVHFTNFMNKPRDWSQYSKYV